MLNGRKTIVNGDDVTFPQDRELATYEQRQWG